VLPTHPLIAYKSFLVKTQNLPTVWLNFTTFCHSKTDKIWALPIGYLRWFILSCADHNLWKFQGYRDVLSSLGQIILIFSGRTISRKCVSISRLLWLIAFDCQLVCMLQTNKLMAHQGEKQGAGKPKLSGSLARM